MRKKRDQKLKIYIQLFNLTTDVFYYIRFFHFGWCLNDITHLPNMKFRFTIDSKMGRANAKDDWFCGTFSDPTFWVIDIDTYWS